MLSFTWGWFVSLLKITCVKKLDFNKLEVKKYVVKKFKVNFWRNLYARFSTKVAQTNTHRLFFPHCFFLTWTVQWKLISILQTDSAVSMVFADMVLLQKEREFTKSIPKWAFAGWSEKFTSELRLDENFYNVINRHIKTLDLPPSQSCRYCRTSENYSRCARGGKCLVVWGEVIDVRKYCCSTVFLANAFFLMSKFHFLPQNERWWPINNNHITLN